MGDRCIAKQQSLGAEMQGGWIRYLDSCELSQIQKATCALLAELSCSPWKFDVLWEVWSDFGLRFPGFKRFADGLLARCTPDLFQCAAIVFDDVTIFWDVVGDFDAQRTQPMSAYRSAYLSLRPFLFRRRSDGDFVVPPVTEETYLMRLAFVMSAMGPEDVEPFCQVLEAAAQRYEGRGKSEGAHLARQNSAVVRALIEGAAPEKAIGSFLPQVFQFLFSLEDVALANELIAQWPTVFPPAMADHVHTQGLTPTESATAVEDVRQLLRAPVPLATLNSERPGIASVALSLCLLRLDGKNEVHSMSLFPPDWVEACQERIVAIGQHRVQDPNLKQALDRTHDYLIGVRHQARLRDDQKGETSQLSLANEGLIQVDLLDIVTRRARQEIDTTELREAVIELSRRHRITSFTVQAIFHYGAMHQNSAPSVSAAALEVASALANIAGSDDVRRQVREALSPKSSAELREIAEGYERQGRADLACRALYNVVVNELNDGRLPSALDTAAKAWAIVDGMRQGQIRVPETVVFDAGEMSLRLALLYGQALARSGDFARCIEIVDSALFDVENVIARMFPTERADLVSQCVRLYGLAAHCEGEVKGVEAIRDRMEAACRLAESFNVPLACCEALCGLSVVASRMGNLEEDLNCLARARAFGEKYRRSSPFEGEKIKACETTQPAFVWAGEKLIELGRTHEALSVFEGLRSRAMCDLLGVATSLVPETPLAENLKLEGDVILHEIRTISAPGSEREGWGFFEHWEQRLAKLDEWLAKVGETQISQQAYVGMVGGRSVTPADIQEWASKAANPTALVWWFLGPNYSYQAVLLTQPGKSFEPPVVRKVPLTLGWLDERCVQFQQSIKSRSNPPQGLLDELAEQLILPIADLLCDAEHVYLCPTQMLHQLPLGALALAEEPLCVAKKVAIVPSLSVLRILESIDRCNAPIGRAVVFGPDFAEPCVRAAQASGGEVEPLFEPASPRFPSKGVNLAPLLHMICHAFHDERDPWRSGFVFNERSADPMKLHGRDLLYWRLNARLVVLEACDTHRSFVSVTDDSFGIARFLHLAGVPSIIMSDWEVRTDVAQVFVEAMYRALATPELWSVGPIGRGEAYRSGVRAARAYAGPENFFLWAPFVLAGVVD